MCTCCFFAPFFLFLQTAMKKFAAAILFLFLVIPVLAGNGKGLPDNLSGGEVSGMVIGQDTVTYRCGSFMQPHYVTLRDLVSALPGVEADDLGNIVVQGQSVKRIYIEGTGIFFYDVPVMANNFPADIIEQIKVYDYTVATENTLDVPYMNVPQKRMNLIIKENAVGKLDAALRMALGGKLHHGEKFLYEGGFSAVAFNREKQSNLVLFADAYNNREIEEQYIQQGYSAGASGFVPVSRNYILNVSGTYKHTGTDEEGASHRMTFYEDSGELDTSLDFSASDKKDMFEFTALLSSTLPGNFQYEVTEVITAGKTDSGREEKEETSEGGSRLNSSVMQESAIGRSFTSSTGLYAVYRSNRESRRAFAFNFAYIAGTGKDDLLQNSIFYGVDDREEISVRNNSRERNNGYDGYFSYAEPISGNWKFNARVESTLSNTTIEGNVLEGDAAYSTYSYNHYLRNNAKALFQYRKGNTLLQMGGAVQGVVNELESRRGEETVFTGKDELIRDWSPFLNFEYTGKRGRELLVKYTGTTANLGNALISTVPDLYTPSWVTFGNIYLQPGFNNTFFMQYRFISTRKENLMYFTVNAHRKRRGVVDAVWFDKAGMQYSVPVNSKKIARNLEIAGNFSNIPVDRTRMLTFNTVFRGSRGVQYGYQAIGESNIIDLQNFNYTAFMEKFWGLSPDGSEFYSGQTGFRESRTRTISFEWDLNFSLATGPVETTLGAGALRNIVKYSLDGAADANTWDFGIYLETEYQSENGWNIFNGFRYNIYEGYAPGLEKNALLWNMNVHKRAGAFIFKLMAEDLLDSSVQIRRTIGACYVEDSSHNVLGRRLMLGVAINF